MARPRSGRIGAALTLFALYRRLPRRHRRVVFRVARRHGPRLALTTLALARRRKADRERDLL